MTRGNTSLFWFGVPLFIGLGILTDVLVGYIDRRAVALRFEPSNIELGEKPRQYDNLSVLLNLVNGGKADATLTSHQVSCGCTDIVLSDGSEIPPGVRIPAGESLPLRLNIDVGGRVGPFEVSVMVESSIGDNSVQCIAAVDMDVVKAVRLVPALIRFNEPSFGDVESASAIISDCYSDFEITSVEVSDSERIDTELIQLPRVKQLPSEREQKCLPRYELHIRYRPKTNSKSRVVNDFVYLASSKANLPRIVLPIVCVMKRGEVTCLPETIVFDERSRGTTLVRKLRVRASGNRTYRSI